MTIYEREPFVMPSATLEPSTSLIPIIPPLVILEMTAVFSYEHELTAVFDADLEAHAIFTESLVM